MLTFAAAGTFLAAMLAASTPLPAQEPPPQPTPLFRTSANVVRVDTLVTSRGKPVTGLQPADFELYDNGVRQQVTAASIEDLDVDVVLALDTSASVRGALLQTLREAAAALVRNLKPGDRAAVVTFASGVTVGTPLTTDHTVVARALEQVEARGATSLVDATWISVLLAHGNDRPTLVLVFSDGVDTSSWLTPFPVLSLASKANLVAEAVVVGSPRLLAERRRGARQPAGGDAALRSDAGVEDFLVELTRATGGEIVDGAGGSKLASAFVGALREFRERYQLSYTPAGVERAGWHRIEVRVARPGVTVRARAGYMQ